MFRTKVIRAEVKVLDPSVGRVEATVSTEDEDRDGDVIRAAGWELDSFALHPVLLASHDYYSLRSQIGEWEDMRVRGKRLFGVARYYVGDGNEEADWGFKLASRGRAAYSVGFLPKEYKERTAKDDGRRGYEFVRQELLEVSHVTVPSNPHALQLLARSLTAGATPVAEIVAELLAEALPTPQGKKDMVEGTAMPCCCVPGCDVAAYMVMPCCKNHCIALMQSPGAQVAGLAIVRAAIPSHETPKADEDASWDAGSEVRRADGEAELRRMHAWVDGDGDPDAKSSYKLPHHRATGEVVWAGVAAAMGALLGARGGVDIPDADRRGVHAHLARHYKQFDRDAPEFRAAREPVDVAGVASALVAEINRTLGR